MMRRLACLIVLALSLPWTASPQSARLEFEVASVKRNDTRSGSSINGAIQGDRLTSTNVTVSQLVRAAYGVQEFQIAEQPGWFDSEKFDIQAKLPADAKPGDWQARLQSLLADRFQLALHRGSKEVSMYALVVNKNGPKLMKADPSKCDPAKANTGCGFRASSVEIIGTGVSMDQLATRLSRSLGRMVVNKTDLKGEFDFTLQWPPDEGAVPLGPGASANPAIFAAIQDQLGLKIESIKGPVETLFIDRVERPSEN